MKRQHPTTKRQRSSKHQASKLPLRGAPADKYPEIASGSWILNEGPKAPNNGRHSFDLEERTAKFGEAIVRFSKKIPCNATNNRLIDQLVGCGSSVGANYREVNESFSKRDFRFSISRCVKEAKETKYFLRLIAASEAP